MEILHTIIDKIIYIVYYIIALIIYFFKYMPLDLRIMFSLQIIFGLVTYFFGYFYRKNFVRKFKKQYPDEEILFKNNYELVIATTLNVITSVVYTDYIEMLLNGNLYLDLKYCITLIFCILLNLFDILICTYIVIITNKRIVRYCHKLLILIQPKNKNKNILLNEIKKIEPIYNKKIIYVYTKDDKTHLPQLKPKYFNQLHQLLLTLLEKEKICNGDITHNYR